MNINETVGTCLLLFRVTGICLEDAGISDNDFVLCDISKRPKQAGDIVVFNDCKNSFMVKRFYGVYGGSQWGKTDYIDPRKNKTVYIGKEKDFIGVVFCSIFF